MEPESQKATDPGGPGSDVATSVADTSLGPRPPAAQVTPAPGFLDDADKLAEFIERMRAAGVRAIEHPSGFKCSFEATLRKSPETW